MTMKLVLVLSLACLTAAVVSPLWAQEPREGSAEIDLEQLEFANGLFHRGMYDMAVIEYAKFIERYPQAPQVAEAHFGIAESQFFAGDAVSAGEAYDDYLDKFSKGKHRSLSYLRLGQLDFRAQQYGQTVALLKHVKPKQLEERFAQVYHLIYARALRETGEADSAVRHFEKAAEYKTDEQTAVLALMEAGDLLAAQKDFARALAMYERAAGETVLDSWRAESAARQGKMLYRLERYDEAAARLTEALKQFEDQPAWKDILATLILSHYAREQFEDVLARYSEYQDRLPSDNEYFPVHYVIVNVYAATGKPEKARELIDRLAGEASLTPERRRQAVFKKAELLLKSGKYQQAVKVLKGMDAGQVENQDRREFYLAEGFYGLKNFNEAYNYYRSIHSRNPGSPYGLDALYGMAHCQNAKGFLREAADIFLSYFDKGDDTGKRQEALYNAVLISAKLEEYQRAVEYCEKYLKEFPEGERRENVLYLAGTLYPKAGRRQDAVNAFRDYLARYPDGDRLAEAHFHLAFNLQETGQPDEALTLYDAIVRNKDSWAGAEELRYPALKNTALIHLQAERLDEAAAIFHQIIRQFGDNDLEAKTYLWLAQYYLKREAYAKALEIVEAISPRQAGVIDTEAAAYFKAEAYRGLKKCDKALAFYDIVIFSKKDNTYTGPAHLGKGQCLVSMFDYDKAREELEKAVVFDPDDHTVSMRARFELGSLEQTTGRLEEAARFYMLVAVLYQDEYYVPESLLRAGEIFEQLDRLEEARKTYQEIIKNYAGSHAGEKAKQRIEALNG